MLELRPYQQEAVAAIYSHLRERDDNPCVVLPTGCHAQDHPILMFDGSVRPVQDVAFGDLLMGPDSQPRRVLALCRGEDELHKVIPHRGTPFVVNGDHVLALVCTNEGKGRFTCQKRGGETETIGLREYRAKSQSWRHLRKLYRVPVEFSARPILPIPPYILGLLLGDGGLTDGVVELTTADEVIADAWSEYGRSINCGVTVSGGGRCPTYTLVRAAGQYNVVTEALTGLDLAGRSSATKFIPQPYLVASREERLALLAGLMDSDGYANKSGCDYVTQSRELATDLVFLVRSLGFAAHCIEKYSACQTGAGGWFFRVSIWGEFSDMPCRLGRRQPKRRTQKKNVLRTGFRVEPWGRGKYYGFVLDGDHLYLDGHFMVHHISGKTPVMATVCRDAVGRWNGRVLILAHVKELLEQALEKIQIVAPEMWLKTGIFSAGLKSRDTEHPIIIAGIQSVYRRACELDAFDLVIIDEAHMIPPDGDGMYRTFLEDARKVNPNLRVIGLTATPFRMKSGMICEPGNVLNEVCYEIGVKELIVQGYLCPLVTKGAAQPLDTSGLHVRAGEFIAGEAEDLMDTDELVESACREIIEQTRDRRSALAFTTGVRHGEHVATALRRMTSEPVATVFGETASEERDRVLAEFKAGRIKYLVNVNVLTMGFDAPNIDCVAMVRPTLSPGLYYQMVGRGFRLNEGKENCLVLDFGGNVLRHGPVDAIRIQAVNHRGNGEAPAKQCPECQSLIAAGYAVCPDCGYEFPPPERRQHEATASTEGILSGEVTTTVHEVRDVFYSVHSKKGAPEDAPKTLRVEYRTGFHQHQSEWICFDHTGWARQKAESWWRRRSHAPEPLSTAEAEALANDGALCRTRTITVRTVVGEQYPRIIGYELDDRPAWREPGMDDDLEPAGVLAGGSAGAYDPLDDDDLPF